MSLYYARVVAQGTRANEYAAAKELKKEHPDDDSMWLGYAALKSAFAKLSVARKKVQAEAEMSADTTTAVGAREEEAGAREEAGAQQEEVGPQEEAGAQEEARAQEEAGAREEAGAQREAGAQEEAGVGVVGQDEAILGDVLDHENPAHPLLEDGYSTEGSGGEEETHMDFTE